MRILETNMRIIIDVVIQSTYLLIEIQENPVTITQGYKNKTELWNRVFNLNLSQANVHP